jgi:hypothetical protein
VLAPCSTIPQEKPVISCDALRTPGLACTT